MCIRDRPEPEPEPMPEPEPEPEPIIPFYVSQLGNDTNATLGNISDPYKTLDFALSKANTENVIYMREGSYELPETQINKKMIVIPHNDEKVTLDGTRSIEDLRDTNHIDGVWKTEAKTIVLDDNTTTTVNLHKIKSVSYTHLTLPTILLV